MERQERKTVLGSTWKRMIVTSDIHLLFPTKKERRRDGKRHQWCKPTGYLISNLMSTSIGEIQVQIYFLLTWSRICLQFFSCPGCVILSVLRDVASRRDPGRSSECSSVCMGSSTATWHSVAPGLRFSACRRVLSLRGTSSKGGQSISSALTSLCMNTLWSTDVIQLFSVWSCFASQQYFSAHKATESVRRTV